MNSEKITTTVKSNYRYCPAEETLSAIVEKMVASKTHGWNLFDKLEAEFGKSVTPGLFEAIKTAIKEERFATGYVSNAKTAATAREDRILRTRTSNGKATSRRW